MTQKLQDLADLVEIQIQLPASNIGSQLAAILGLGNLVLFFGLLREPDMHVVDIHIYRQIHKIIIDL